MTSLVPSNSLKAFLGEASETYYQALRQDSAAIAYLKSRGISGDSAASFRLGVVASPLLGHEQYTGRLCIPYRTRAGTVSVRFRCITCQEKCEGHPKYWGTPGDILRLFNPDALHIPTDYIVICEGEIDTITAVQAGLPAVGFPGVSALREYSPRLFAGYERVLILADNDDKGQGETFAERIAELVKNSRIVKMPTGHDVNSFVCAEGPEALLDRLEIKK